MNRLRLLTLVVMILAIATWYLKQDDSLTVTEASGLVVDASWMVPLDNPLTPESYRRPPDQTFLTYPEWFLVHSPAEMAESFRAQTSTGFPYKEHVSQIWGSYTVINDQINETFPYNDEYHMMIKVIGVSSTIEYWLRQVYEVVIGRLTDTEKPITAEDQFNQQYIHDYVTFIHEKPWYLYDFNAQLKKLWSDTPLWGDHMFRKLERRYILTSELLVKSAYGYLIGVGTKELYGTAASTTAVVVNNLNQAQLSDHNVVESYSDTKHLVELPRYRPFKQAAINIAKAGGEFEEIAGNNSAILLTVLTGQEWNDDTKTKVIFNQPLPSNPELNRLAIVTPVPYLHELLLRLDDSGTEIEHLYDF